MHHPWSQSSRGCCSAAARFVIIATILSDPVVAAGWVVTPTQIIPSSTSSFYRHHPCRKKYHGSVLLSSNIGLQCRARRIRFRRQTKTTCSNTAQKSPAKSSSNTAIFYHFGLDDFVFDTENIGLSLANTVLHPSSSSSGISTSAGGYSSLLFSSLTSIKSILILYIAGLLTSFSPCSLGLLPVTISYISNAANERNDTNTILPTFAYAAGLALVFTTLGVSASVLGGVFGSSTSAGSGGGVGGGNQSIITYLLAIASPLVSILMGLQLLELIRIPLPTLDFKLRNALVFQSRSIATLNGGTDDTKTAGSLFDESGGLLLENLKERNVSISNNSADSFDDGNNSTDEVAALVRMFLLGGTSALVASPCATPVLASLLAYLASVSSLSSEKVQSLGDVWKGASWMLSYTLGYSTLLLVVGATGGQALVNLRRVRDSNNAMSGLWQWITPLSGGVLIVFGMNGLLVALLGDPSLSALAPILD